MKKAEAACAAAVNEQVRPELEQTAVAVLGERSDPWFEFAVDETTKSPVLLFRYPTTQLAGLDYVKRSVKLEFGSLTEQQPTGRQLTAYGVIEKCVARCWPQPHARAPSRDSALGRAAAHSACSVRHTSR